MKICPLISQASILEGSDRELLFREADTNDLDEKDENEHEESVGNEETCDDPGPDSKEEGGERSGGGDAESCAPRSARFLAKSYRGEVECLGAICRFYDEGAAQCRFERMMAAAGEDPSAGRLEEIKTQLGKLEEIQGDTGSIQELRGEVEKSWEFQQSSTSEILGLFKEQAEKIEGLRTIVEESFNKRMDDMRDLLSTMTDENKLIVESVSDSLAERYIEIEGKLAETEKTIGNFRSEVTEWKGVMNKNLDALGKDLDNNKQIVDGLTKSNAEIMKVVENQKRTLEEEERKSQLAEAKRLNNAGVMAYHNGRYEKALEHFEKALELEPAFTEAYNNIGLTYTEMNEEDKATEAFKKAIELNPDLAVTYNNLGYVFYRMGSYHEAIEMYNEAIGKSRDNSSAYTNLGNAYYKLDRIDEAIEAWRRALEIDPGNEKARRNLSRFHAGAEQSG